MSKLARATALPVPTFELLSPGKYVPAEFWRSLSPQTTRIEIEIGPGSGGFLLAAAAARQDTLFVGFEIKATLAEELIEAAAPIPNAAAYRIDGRWAVPHIIASQSIDAYHIYFPDPWWKKRHHKRRLFTEEFSSGLERTLKPGGAVYLISDVLGTFERGQRALLAAGLNEQSWSRATTDPAQSGYERKYRRQGRQLYEGKFSKT